MSDVVDRSDIEAFISTTFPEQFDVLRKFFTEYSDGLLNHSALTPKLSVLPSIFNQFESSGLSPFLLYDKGLARYSHYDIRNLVALSIMDSGPSFFTLFMRHFFDRFEMYYSDSNENRYETISSVIYSDDGHVTDDLEFTDGGTGVGVYTIMTQIIFPITERDALALKFNDAFQLLSYMKPARLVVYMVPTVDVRINQLLSDDPEYVPALVVAGPDQCFDVTIGEAGAPSNLITDRPGGTILTDGGISTDFVDTKTYLEGINTIVIKKASAPTVSVTINNCNNYVEKMSYGYYFEVETELDEDIVYLELIGGFSIFQAVVTKPLYIKAHNTDGHMRLRISWHVMFGQDGT